MSAGFETKGMNASGVGDGCSDKVETVGKTPEAILSEYGLVSLKAALQPWRSALHLRRSAEIAHQLAIAQAICKASDETSEAFLDRMTEPEQVAFALAIVHAHWEAGCYEQEVSETLFAITERCRASGHVRFLAEAQLLESGYYREHEKNILRARTVCCDALLSLSKYLPNDTVTSVFEDCILHAHIRQSMGLIALHLENYNVASQIFAESHSELKNKKLMFPSEVTTIDHYCLMLENYRAFSLVLEGDRVANTRVIQGSLDLFEAVATQYAALAEECLGCEDYYSHLLHHAKALTIAIRHEVKTLAEVTTTVTANLTAVQHYRTGTLNGRQRDHGEDASSMLAAWTEKGGDSGSVMVAIP